MRIVNRDDDQLPENSCQISKRQVDNWTRLEIFNGIMNRLKLFKYQTIFNYRFTCIYEIIEKKNEKLFASNENISKNNITKKEGPLCTCNFFVRSLYNFLRKSNLKIRKIFETLSKLSGK